MGKKAEIELQKEEIQLLVDKGLNNSQIARELGISLSTVIRRKKEIEAGVTAGVIMSGGVSVHLGEKIDVIQQMRDINAECWSILKKATKNDEKLAATREIRAQLELHLKISQEVYRAENVQRFQEGVLEALGNADPRLRDEAIKNINRLKEMAGVVLMGDV